MDILVAGGTGFIGRALVGELLKHGHNVIVLGRSSKKITRLFGDKVVALTWEALPKFGQPVAVVIQLSGKNIGQRLWTNSVRAELIASRVNCNKKLISWCLAQQQKPRFYAASAVGIYGCYADTSLAFDETSQFPIQPTCFSQHMVLAVESSAQHPELTTTQLRFGIVLERGQGILKQMVYPFYFGLGAIIGSGRQGFAWVALTDVLAAIIFLLDHPEIQGPVNITAPEKTTQAQFALALGQALNRPLWLRLPKLLLSKTLGTFADELLLSGQVVLPQKLIGAGFSFQGQCIKDWLLRKWS